MANLVEYSEKKVEILIHSLAQSFSYTPIVYCLINLHSFKILNKKKKSKRLNQVTAMCFT